MRLTASVVVVILLLSVGPAGAQLIFSDDFEWGSICAWSNDLWYADFDDDGFGDSEDPGLPSDCPAPSLRVSNNFDCDDMAETVHPGAAEVCDGADNDCDPASADGSEDPSNGAACDGVDSDLCLEGTYSCEAGSLTCSDVTGSTLDVCDGADNDCDPASADGSEDPSNGAACDGADSDLCLEGTYSCEAGSLTCSDTTGDLIEVCDGADNDCDLLIDEDWSCSISPDGCCPPDCTAANDADCCESQACSMTSDLCCPSSCSSANDVDCG
jgi:hypothetical protein